GECGTASAGLLGDASKQRERLTDAKAAYTRYAEVEKRSKYTKGGHSRIAVAKSRVALLESQIATIAVPEEPALAAISPESPTPGIPGVEGTGDLTSTAAPAPEPTLVGSPGPVVAASGRHEPTAPPRVPITVVASDAAEGYSTTQPAGTSPEQRRPVTHEDLLKCLTA
ncbi:MAG: hypothetical protein Q7S02_04680, partial [bacterium]|nr:hypothetical protein [bacterium]